MNQVIKIAYIVIFALFIITIITTSSQADQYQNKQVSIMDYKSAEEIKKGNYDKAEEIVMEAKKSISHNDLDHNKLDITIKKVQILRQISPLLVNGNEQIKKGNAELYKNNKQTALAHYEMAQKLLNEANAVIGVAMLDKKDKITNMITKIELL